MNSKKLQMLTAAAASILLGIGLATVPAAAKTNKESSAYSAQASSNEKKPSKKSAKKQPSKQSAKNTTKSQTVGQGGGHLGHQEYDGP
jgi:hypothetical protein